MTEETRYRKTKRIEQDKARHEGRVQNLSAPIEEQFEKFLEENTPPCVKAGLPSPWTDWATDPEVREDYETEAPDKHFAAALCASCPIRAVEFGGNGLCPAYAKATNQQHGVWGGLALEIRTVGPQHRQNRAVWLHAGREAHTARRTSNDDED